MAAAFLTSHGVEVVARNVRLDRGEVDRGEIDLLAIDHGQRVVVEVRTVTGRGDPIDAVGHAKRRRVRRLASAIGAARVDFVGVRIGADDVLVHWVPGCG
jgi:Holliday junction resolvase-like predicted endonuclease